VSEPFLAEIKLISWNFPPKGWAFCNGQLMQINQNQALFSILGTTYGGDGRVTFALPDLRDRVPVHVGNGFTLGQRGGEEAHTLIQSEMPTHTHFVMASSGNADQANPSVLAGSNKVYGAPSNLTTLGPSSVVAVGGSQPHTNVMPYLTLNFVIALQGIFPSQN
jgi:microcystin-dependent protein